MAYAYEDVPLDSSYAPSSSTKVFTSGLYAYTDGDEEPSRDDTFSPVDLDHAQDVHHDAIKNSTIPEVEQRNWHQQYLQLLEQFEKNPTSENARSLVDLNEAFVAAATTIAKFIVEERGLPDFARALKPLDAGGVAGGVKFKHANIFFKVAVDEHGLYGSDQVAGKVASLEILSNNFLISAYDTIRGGGDDNNDVTLRFPLCVCVIYCGITVLASSVLPVTKNTLVYGSCDGGQTVVASHDGMNRTVRRLSRQLNLKQHQCQKTVLSLAADVEGHLGTDGVFYLLDTARTFPCEAPSKAHAVKGGHLFRLLRPDFVVNFWKKGPLSSDAWSGFGRGDPEQPVHNEEVKSASEYLYAEVIPFFYQRCKVRKIPSDAKAFIRELHLFGLNVRHLGALYSMAVNDAEGSKLASAFLDEMLARCVKNHVRDKLSKNLIDLPKVGVDTAHRQALSEVFIEKNAVVLGKLRERLIRDFPRVTAPAELAFSNKCVRRAAELLNCSLSNGQFSCNGPRVKKLYAFSFFLSRSMVNESHARLSVEEARLALEVYKATLEAFSGAVFLLNNLAVAALEVVRKIVGAQLPDSSNECSKLLELADSLFCTVNELRVLEKLESTGEHAESLMNWAVVAKFRAELFDDNDWAVMESRVRAALAIKQNENTLVPIGCFLLGKMAFERRDKDLLDEMKDRLSSFIDNSTAGSLGDTALYDCGVLHFWSKDAVKARKYFLMAADRPSTRSGALYMLAILSFEQGQLIDCEDFCKTCLKEDANFFKAKIMQAKSMIARADGSPDPAERFQTKKDAAALLEQARSESAFGGEVPFLLGKIYRDIYYNADPSTRPASLIREALFCFREATDNMTGNPTAWIYRALSAWDVAVAYPDWNGFSCDGCSGGISGERYHCATCGNFDFCSNCFQSQPHEHEMQKFDCSNASLLEECHDNAVIALCMVDPTIKATSLVDFLSSNNGGCVTQALDTMQRLSSFGSWAKKLCAFGALQSLAKFNALTRYAMLFLKNCAYVPSLCPQLDVFQAKATEAAGGNDPVASAAATEFLGLIKKDLNQ